MKYATHVTQSVTLMYGAHAVFTHDTHRHTPEKDQPTMTRRQLWRTIGKHIRLRNTCICPQLFERTLGRHDLYAKENARLRAFKPRKRSPYAAWWPLNNKGQKRRLEVCKILAGDTKR